MLLPELAKNKEESMAVVDLPMLQEYAFDLEKNEFKLRNGKHYLVSGNEALKIWVKKALMTERFRYDAYSNGYGSELESLIGAVLTNSERQSEIKRMIIEALMVNPYIVSIDNIEIVFDGSKLIANIELTSIYGKEEIEWKPRT